MKFKKLNESTNIWPDWSNYGMDEVPDNPKDDVDFLKSVGLEAHVENYSIADAEAGPAFDDFGTSIVIDSSDEEIRNKYNENPEFKAWVDNCLKDLPNDYQSVDFFLMLNDTARKTRSGVWYDSPDGSRRFEANEELKEGKYTVCYKVTMDGKYMNQFNSYTKAAEFAERLRKKYKNNNVEIVDCSELTEAFMRMLNKTDIIRRLDLNNPEALKNLKLKFGTIRGDSDRLKDFLSDVANRALSKGHFEVEPYDSGDYWTPSSGGYINCVEWDARDWNEAAVNNILNYIWQDFFSDNEAVNYEGMSDEDVERLFDIFNNAGLVNVEEDDYLEEIDEYANDAWAEHGADYDELYEGILDKAKTWAKDTAKNTWDNANQKILDRRSIEKDGGLEKDFKEYEYYSDVDKGNDYDKSIEKLRDIQDKSTIKLDKSVNMNNIDLDDPDSIPDGKSQYDINKENALAAKAKRDERNAKLEKGASKAVNWTTKGLNAVSKGLDNLSGIRNNFNVRGGMPIGKAPEKVSKKNIDTLKKNNPDYDFSDIEKDLEG